MQNSSKNPSAYIIVLNWNGRNHLDACFGSLENIAYNNCRLLMVDNASTDGSVEWVASRYPQVEMLQNGRNLGFSGGNNVGIRYALIREADYIVLLNNDTRVEPDFLDRLIQYGEAHPDVGVLGGTVKMDTPPCRINSTGVHLNLLAYGWDRDFGMPCEAVERENGPVLAVTGAMMAVKRTVFDRIGLLDTCFFAYFEDVDFCIRVWQNTGLAVHYVSESIVYHRFSGSAGILSPEKKRLMMENQYRIFFKYYPAWTVLLLFPVLTVCHLAQNRSDPQALIEDLLIACQYAISLPAMVADRGLSFFRKEAQSASRFWEKVIKEIGLPKIPVLDGINKNRRIL